MGILNWILYEPIRSNVTFASDINDPLKSFKDEKWTEQRQISSFNSFIKKSA